VRFGAGQGLGVAAATLVLSAALASPATAAPAPPCDTAAYPTPFLKFYGGIFNSTTRFIELQIRPAKNSHSTPNEHADIEYPFTVTVTRSDGFSRSFNVTNYAKQRFAAKYANRSQTNHVSTNYTEIHTDWNPVLPGVPVNTRCSRTISATYKVPPKEKKPPRRTGGGRNGGGHREDDDED